MEQTKNFLKNNLPQPSIKLLLLSLFLASFYYYVEYKQNKDNDSYVATQVLTYFKSENEAQFSHSVKIGNSSILEISSFAEKTTIISTIENLKSALDELDEYPQIYSKIAQGAKEIILNSNMSEKGKEEAIGGLEKSELNPESKGLRENYVAAQSALYRGVLSLYEFLLANFDDYQIKLLEDGSSDIHFNTKSNTVKYDQLVSQIQDLAKNYREADSNLKADIHQSSASTPK